MCLKFLYRVPGCAVQGPDPKPIKVKGKTLIDFNEFWIRPCLICCCCNKVHYWLPLTIYKNVSLPLIYKLPFIKQKGTARLLQEPAAKLPMDLTV